ncbi:MAG TPA: type VI secretion system baseplate subunit TssE [Xanthobacteraceae bacterium]|nr:type VI secretion system baseplate subunit TssE [Xanthobacteraceae bacterium]
MVGSNRKDRLSPPLMYAFRGAHEARDAKTKLDLRDEAGERVIASRRMAVRTAITEPTLRREVARDLDSLMNTIAMESSEDLQRFEHVRKSVLNFGLPDITHRSIDELSVENIGDEIKSALVNYEPRLIPQTIRVSRSSELDEAELKVRFVVRADLLCEPLNVPVEFVADLELDSGNITLSRT